MPVTDADILGLPLEFEFQGEVYKIENPISFGTEATFARWCYTDSLNELTQMNALYRTSRGQYGISDEQYEKSCTRLDAMLAAGEFSWGTAIVHNKHTKTWPGIKMLLLLRFRRYQPKISMQIIDAIFDDAESAERLAAVLNPTEADVKEPEKKEIPVETSAPVAS